MFSYSIAGSKQRPFILALAGCLGLAASALAAETTGFGERHPRYRIEPSDVLEMHFRFTPEYNQTVTVQPDGFIPLPSAGDVRVAGLTLGEARQAVLAKYTGILHEPELTLVLKEFTRPGVLVGGEVVKPGRFELRGEMTLSEAILLAGGLNPGGRKSEVLLFRRVSRDTAEVKKVNLAHLMEKGRLNEDVYLQAGDSIYVSRSLVGKIERFMSVTRLGMYFNPVMLK